MLKNGKSFFSHIWQFILSNLIPVGIYAVLLLIVTMFAGSAMETLSKNNRMVSIIVYLFLAIGWIVSFYIYHFKIDMGTAELLRELRDGCSVADMFRNKMLDFLKHDTIWLAAFVILVAFVPQSSPITFLFSSAGIFISIGNQVVGSLLWGGFIVASYAGCCLVFCQTMKKKADKQKEQYSKSI